MSDCCKQCFDLTPTTAGAVAGKYCVEQIGGQSVWYSPTGRRITSATLIAELVSLTDTTSEQAAASVLCKDERCHLTSGYNIEIGTPGVRIQTWQTSAVPYDNDLNVTFSGPEDLNCMPTHPNTADVDTIDTNWSHVDATYGAGGTGAPVSQTVASGWVIFPETVLLRDNNGSVETGRVYLGKCGEKPKIVSEWVNTNTNPNPFAEVGPGLYFIGVQISDPSANSGFNLQYSTDNGASFSNVPTTWLSSDKPKVSCERVEVCPRAGTIKKLDGTEVTVDGISFSWCSPCADCCGSTAVESTDSGSSCEDIDTPLTVQTGVNSNVPAGFKSVTINNLTGITTLNGQFQLGTGRRVDSISFSTDRGNCVNETLPAYTLSGGTWQWIGHLE